MAQFQIATDYYKAENFERAIKEYDKLPECKEVLIQKALAYKELRRYDVTRELLEKARTALYSDGTRNDEDNLSLHNLGSLYYTLEEKELASDYYLAAYIADPTNKQSILNYGYSLLRRYCDGEDVNTELMWKCYDQRFNYHDLVIFHSDTKYWDFKEEGDSIAVLWDQGYGDNIMFARYIPYLKKYFKHVYIQSATPLMGLMQLIAPIYTNFTPCTHCVCITSLGKLLPYIPDGRWLKGYWEPPESGRIGYVSSGNPDHQNDKNRSCPDKYFKDYEKIDISGTFADTIHELEKFDSVISVDTSIVHLCGALDMPCRVLMPLTNCDYRWGTVGSETVWYPSVKIIRNPGTWEECFERA